jgi:hypothetical protein
MVIEIVKSPELSVVTVIVSRPQTLIVTEVSGAYPWPLKVIVPPGGADPELELSPPQFFEYAHLAAVR